MVSRELLKRILAGAFIGYVFIHPLIMIISYFMSDISYSNASPAKVGLLSEILNQIESYIREHSEAEFTHSICPECSKKLYPDFYNENNSTTKA